MITRPPLTHTVQLEEGQSKVIKMTYGLFNDMQRVTPDPTAILTVVQEDAWTRDYLVRRALTDKKGAVTDEDQLIQIEDAGVEDPEEVAKLLEWITGHLLFFFGTSARGLKRLSEEFKIDESSPTEPSTSGSQS